MLPQALRRVALLFHFYEREGIRGGGVALIFWSRSVAGTYSPLRWGTMFGCAQWLGADAIHVN
ncbi:hypothetical protein [Microbulbifer sp. THAF38]|uniref:hypothetical protein n=1 Tax=Microbulbifer sp. THAF38 TaxID=2587856 RepID=UPI001267C160|nr:hypothetical protein [Microbulbifer sp. THAF38]